MEEELVAKLILADTKVGDPIKTLNGDLVRILKINRVKAISRETVLIYIVAEPIKP